MSKISPPMSPARRNAEALLNQSKKREASLKWEQEREYEAMLSKTARLRELRLAKEAAIKKQQLRPPFCVRRHGTESRSRRIQNLS